MSVKMKFGSKDIPFVYKGDKLIYPNPIKDGLLLWYDFKGMRNTDTNKEVAKDLSGNGNDGTLTNFNFTEGSGYKDNTLIFDGVDDSLTIPELELDETAMTVVQDGKIYSYEDDKVLTVGEDGEIAGSGKNLLPSFYNSAWYKRQSDFVINPYHLRSAKGVRHAIVATIVLDVKPNTDYTIFMNTDLGRTRISSDSGSGDIMGYQNGDFSRVFNTGTSESIEVELGVFSGNVGEEINFSNAMLCQGRLTQHSFTPTPEDFQTTSLSPASLTDLQLYNKTLLKDELLHNAENKGLKKLKPGVPVQDGLVLHYDFSHESNTSEYKDKAFDYSGNGNHGELRNFGYAEESGYVEDGLKFDGVDDYVVSPDRFDNIYTQEATAIFSGGEEMYSTLTGTLNHMSEQQSGFAVTIVFGDRIRVNLGTGKGLSVNSLTNTGVNIGDKFHVVAVVDELLLKVYINGVFNQEFQMASFDPIQKELTGFYVGRYGVSYDYYKAADSIFSAKAYNRPLTAEEVAHNYQIEKEKFNIAGGDA